MNVGRYGTADELQTFRMASMADTAQPCLAIWFSQALVAGESADSAMDGATITIDADGGASSELLITLKINRLDNTGTATTDTTYTIDGTTYDTLKKIIDYINGSCTGFRAAALHAPHDMDTGQANFIDLTETEIRTDGKPYNCLYRDVSAFVQDTGKEVNWLRVGYPEFRDSGRMKLIRVAGTTTGNTNGTVKVIRDNYGETQQELLSFTQQTAETAYVDEDVMTASTYRGPLLIEVQADNLTATDIVCVVKPADL